MSDGSSALRDALSRNLGYKLVSLLLAIGMWAWVQSDVRVEERVRVPVRWTLPEGYALVEAPLETAWVTVEGVQGSVRSLTQADLLLSIDLGKAGGGEVNVDLGQRPVEHLPAQVRVKAIQPSSLRVTLERILRRRMEVDVATRGELAAGLRLVGTRVRPATIDVVGPTSLVQRLGRVSTEAIDLAGLRETQEMDVRVALPKAQLLGNPGKVTVTVEVAEAARERRFEGIVPTVEGGGFAASPVSVVLRGPADRLAALGEDAVQVRVLMRGATAGPAHLGAKTGATVAVVVPGATEDIEVVAVEPAEVDLSPVEAP